MSNNLDFLNVRSLNGLGYISSNDIEQIGDLTIDGDLEVTGSVSGNNLKSPLFFTSYTIIGNLLKYDMIKILD